MSTSVSRKRSAHEPVVRNGLCRYIRSKGMIVNIDEPDSAEAGFVARYMAADPNALPYDATIWWCTMTSKPLGPDDEPCDRGKCVAGRECFEPEG
jgi:hypothetical protein